MTKPPPPTLLQSSSPVPPPAPRPAVARAPRPEPRCASPRCGEARVPGGRFCIEHAELFARMRGELAADGQRRRSPDAKGRISSVKLGSTCCNPQCMRARRPPANFCAECQTDGWNEDAE